MHKKLYYLLMTAGSFAVVIMLGISVMVLGMGGCSSNYEDNPLLRPPNTLLPDKGICCVADEEFPSSCDGFITICEE